MRISNNTLFRSLLTDLNKNRQRVAEFQSNLSSGKRVRKASDDPANFTSARLIEVSLRSIKQFQENNASGLRKARTVQESLESMLDLLMDMKQKVIQGANETLGASNRKALAEHITGIRDNIISTANAKSEDVYMFGGTNTMNKPFTLDTAVPPTAPGGVADISNGTRLTVQISSSQTLEVSITGNELRTLSSGEDLFEVIERVTTALTNNDPDAVRAELGNVEDAITHVSSLATEMASSINQMEYMFEYHEAQKIDHKSEISRATDTDFAFAMSQIQKMQIAYQAAMNAHARISQTSLMDYLR